MLYVRLASIIIIKSIQYIHIFHVATSLYETTVNVVSSTQHIHVRVQHSQATITEFIPLVLEVVYRHLLLRVLLLEVGPLGPERRVAAQKSNHLRPVGGEGSSPLSIPLPHPQRDHSHGTWLFCPAPPPHSTHMWSHPTQPAPFDTHPPETEYTPPQTPEPPRMAQHIKLIPNTRCCWAFY